MRRMPAQPESCPLRAVHTASCLLVGCLDAAVWCCLLPVTLSCTHVCCLSHCHQCISALYSCLLNLHLCCCSPPTTSALLCGKLHLQTNSVLPHCLLVSYICICAHPICICTLFVCICTFFIYTLHMCTSILDLYTLCVSASVLALFRWQGCLRGH